VRPEKSEAFILQTFPSRERDKLVVFLTPEHGKKRGWAYGARSMKSRFGAALEPLSKVRIGYLEKENEEVVRIESIDLLRSLFDAHRDLATSLSATYLAELADTFAQADDPAEMLFRLLDVTTASLLAGNSPYAIVTYAEIWTLRLAGIFPSLRNCIVCANELERPLRFDAGRQGFVCNACATRDAAVVPNTLADALTALLRLPVAEFASLELARDDLFELRSLARGLRRNFLGHELKSHDLLGSVL
jgi:DNA repair protein RecO (recombination protein O)